MKANKAGSVLVTDKDVVSGIFTERDYLTKVCPSTTFYVWHARAKCRSNDVMPAEVSGLSVVLPNSSTCIGSVLTHVPRR